MSYESGDHDWSPLPQRVFFLPSDRWWMERAMAKESSLEIPASVRAIIHERDQRFCRLCGRFQEHPEIHHLVFGGTARGMGGRRVHNPEEMVTLCSDCHRRAHREKSVWVKWLLMAIENPGVTAVALKRRRQRARS